MTPAAACRKCAAGRKQLQTLLKEDARSPENTLAAAPDNRSA
jgi:hypothetical protein